MITLDDLRKLDAKEREARPSVEDVVRRWEARPVELVDTKADVDALIAAWRSLCTDRDSWRDLAEYWEKIARLAVAAKP